MDSPIGAHHDLERIKMLASDLDGTLLDGSHSINMNVISAVEDLYAHASIPIYVATGRSRSSALSKFSEAGLDWEGRPGVFLNGAVVYGRSGEIIHERTFPIEVLEAVVLEFQGDLSLAVVMACCEDTIQSPQICEISTHLHEVYADPYPVSHGTYKNMLNNLRVEKMGIHMISIATKDCRETERQIVERLKQVLNEFRDPAEFSIVTPIPRLITVLPRNTCKGGGVLALCKWLGIDPSHVAAVGDSSNDIEMLRMVGVGVAVANAKEDVKKHAKLIVNRNDDPELPGVAHLARLVLNAVRRN